MEPNISTGYGLAEYRVLWKISSAVASSSVHIRRRGESSIFCSTIWNPRTPRNAERKKQRLQFEDMGKQPVRLKAVVYALSPFQQKVMTGLWKDLPGKIHHKVSENWISATLLLGPIIGVHTYVLLHFIFSCYFEFLLWKTREFLFFIFNLFCLDSVVYWFFGACILVLFFRMRLIGSSY